MLNIGDRAPNFTLKDKNGNDVSLSDFIGKKVVLYFYPKDNTPGCTRQACAFAGASETPLEQRFGQYELDYFNFISDQFRCFYMNDGHMPTWDEAVEEYKKDTIRDFPKIIAHILQERCSTWNKTVGAHINNQLEL